jgi:hypothetical protein
VPICWVNMLNVAMLSVVSLSDALLSAIVLCGAT